MAVVVVVVVVVVVANAVLFSLISLLYTQLSPEVLTAQWFLTLFSYTLPCSETLLLWDYLMLTGWTGIFKVEVV